MNKKILDILVCPICKHTSLEMFQIKVKDEVITEGSLFCPNCSRFYPIIEEIPIMLPDELRDKKQDIDFLTRNKDKLPEKIINEGIPWHL